MKKQDAHNALLEFLNQQLEELSTALEKVQESIVGEEKSTAGDKYETARAMAHNELERLNRQKAIVLKHRSVVNRMLPDRKFEECQTGAFIQLKSKALYLSVGIGKVAFGDSTFFAISSGSPIGQSILGKRKGDMIKMGNTHEEIMDIQ